MAVVQLDTRESRGARAGGLKVRVDTMRETEESCVSGCCSPATERVSLLNREGMTAAAAHCSFQALKL